MSRMVVVAAAVVAVLALVARVEVPTTCIAMSVNPAVTVVVVAEAATCRYRRYCCCLLLPVLL